VIEVTIRNKNALQILNMVQELQSSGFKTNEDFEFCYHKAEWNTVDGVSGYTRQTVFRFNDPSIATWFSVKFNT
jgi:3-methyladenine DNA glycosylase AlkD